MLCCAKPNLTDFDMVARCFAAEGKRYFQGIGKREWPVFFDPKGNLALIHSPVGTASLFDEHLKSKMIISGFSTSLNACSRYLYDLFNIENANFTDLEVKYTFYSLMTNIQKILEKTGLLEHMGINGNIYNNQLLIKHIRENSERYPVMMTQAMCCIGTNKRSNANKIVRHLLHNNFDANLENAALNSLSSWLTRLSDLKDNRSVLLLLGYGKRPAILQLLQNTYITDLHDVSFKPGTGMDLLKFLYKMFDNRVGFIPHPSNLTDKRLNEYLSSTEKTRVVDMVKAIW